MKKHLLEVTLALGLVVTGNGVGYAGSVAARPATTSRAVVKAMPALVPGVEVGTFKYEFTRAHLPNDPSHDMITLQGKSFLVPATMPFDPTLTGTDGSQVIMLTTKDAKAKGVPESTVNQPPPTWAPTDQPPPTWSPTDQPPPTWAPKN